MAESERTYEQFLKERALETRARWEAIIVTQTPFECKKCSKMKKPAEFVTYYTENPIAGKYRVLYECKECKKNRITKKGAQD